MQKLFFLCILLPIPSLLFSFELMPDSIKSHCVAFSGKWKKGRCIDRLEFQQNPIREGITVHLDQWCEARGGVKRKYRTGLREPCEGAVSRQGLQRIENPNLKKFQVYQDVVNICVNRNLISADTCTVSATDENDRFNFTGESNHVVAVIANAIDSIVRTVNKPFYNYKGLKEEKILISELKDVMRKGLSSCQKACLVKCAASQVLTYSYDWDTKFRGIADIYDKRLGECTEFASVAQKLGRKLDVEVKYMAGDAHAYNIFKIDGLWYYGEPQSESCTFYHTRKTLDIFQDQTSLSLEQLSSPRIIGKDVSVENGGLCVPEKSSTESE